MAGQLMRDSVTGCDTSQVVTSRDCAELTRDKLEGKRFSASRHVTPTSAPLIRGLPDLSLAQAEALRKYSKDTERCETSRDADRRFEAKQALSAARSAIGPRGTAIVDLVLIKGRGLVDLAHASGQPVAALAELFTTTADTLADHYQTREARHG